MHFLSLRNGEASTLASPPEALADDELLWCDCLYEESQAWVEPLQRLTGLRIFDDHLRDAENTTHPSYFESTRDYEVVIFRGLAFNTPQPDPATPIRLRTRPTTFFLLPGCLVTIRSPESRLIPEARDRMLGTSEGSAGPPQASFTPTGGGLGEARPWGHSESSAGPPQASFTPTGGGPSEARPWGHSESSAGPPQAFFTPTGGGLGEARPWGRSKARHRLPGSPEELMLRLLSAMVDRYLELRQPLTDQLDRWQRQLLDPRKPFRDWPTLLDARTELRKLEQLCEEQLDALQEWKDERLEIAASDRRLGPLSDALLVRTNDLVNHIHRVLHHARRLQESVESAVQLHFSSTAFRTNEVMRTLTTITAIFMPLTLITGIFGMNFEFLPGLHTRLGFWVTIGTMAAIAIGLLAYFSARRYFGVDSTVLRSGRRRPRIDPPAGSA